MNTSSTKKFHRPIRLLKDTSAKHSGVNLSDIFCLLGVFNTLLPLSSSMFFPPEISLANSRISWDSCTHSFQHSQITFGYLALSTLCTSCNNNPSTFPFFNKVYNFNSLAHTSHDSVLSCTSAGMRTMISLLNFLR
jgi:hypothetical protein